MGWGNDKAVVVVKTVAGMLDDRNGILLTSLTDNGVPVGLDDGYDLVKPPTPDGFVNWVDALFEHKHG